MRLVGVLAATLLFVGCGPDEHVNLDPEPDAGSSVNAGTQPAPDAGQCVCGIHERVYPGCAELGCCTLTGCEASGHHRSICNSLVEETWVSCASAGGVVEGSDCVFRSAPCGDGRSHNCACTTRARTPCECQP